MMKQLLLGISILLLLAGTAFAEVGLGISPSKAKIQVQAGETANIDFLVFNTGNRDVDVTMTSEGDITGVVTAHSKRWNVYPLSPEACFSWCNIESDLVYNVK